MKRSILIKIKNKFSFNKKVTAKTVINVIAENIIAKYHSLKRIHLQNLYQFTKKVIFD